jgi:hypothetical protein
MEQLADIRLNSFLEVLGPKALFHNGDANKTSVAFNTPASGAGNIVTYSGPTAADGGGFYLADKNKVHIAALRNGTGIGTQEMNNLRILLDAEHANAVIGGNGQDGDLVMRNETGVTVVHFTAGIGLEGNNVQRIVTETANLKFNGATGLMELKGAMGGRLQLKDSAALRKIDLNGQDGTGQFADVRIGAGNDYVASLLAKLKNLESRIAALEARP